MTERLKKYLKIKKKFDDAEEMEDQDKLLEKLNDLYYELDDEEIAYLEEKGLSDF